MYSAYFDSDREGIILSANVDRSDKRFIVWGCHIYSPKKLQLDTRSGTRLYFADGKSETKRIKIWVTDMTRLNSQRIVKRIDVCDGTA